MSNVEVSPDGRSSTSGYGASGGAPTAATLVDHALERRELSKCHFDLLVVGSSLDT